MELLSALLLCICTTTFLHRYASAQWAPATTWRSWGQDINGSRFSDQGCTNKASIKKWGIPTQWTSSSNGGVSATPTVCNGVVYFPDWAGNMYAMNAASGAVIWRKAVAELIGAAAGTRILTRNSPAVNDDCSVLYIGTYSSVPAHMLALSSSSGNLLWKQKLDDHIRSAVTQSPVFHAGALYVGLASSEEVPAAVSTCCTFRGSYLKINATVGTVNWKTFLTPASGGWSGAAVWGSSSAISPTRNLVYLATGNNYKVPASYQSCVNNAKDWDSKQKCNPPDNYVDSVVALDMDSGRVVWNQLLVDQDVYTMTGGSGKDYDFAQGPILVGNILLAGQKAGWIWALNAATGVKIWDKAAYPPNTAGSIMWGSASDGSKFYYGTHWWDTTQAGYVGAKNIVDGSQAWFFKNPTGGKFFGAVSASNGLVFAPSMDQKLYILDSDNGNLLTTYTTDYPLACGPSIANRTVFFGTGYRITTTTKFYALQLPGPSPAVATCPSCGVLYGNCCVINGVGTCLDGQDAFCEKDINKCYRNCGKPGQICCEKQGYCYTGTTCQSGICR